MQASSTTEDKVYTKESDGNKKIPVIEIFGPTIQGEGAMIGVKTLFVRLGGCDYRCTKCDSLHAVIPQAVKANATWMEPQELVEQIIELASYSQTQWVTVSGGNPAMWGESMELVVRLLHKFNMYIAVETQGTIWQPWLALVNQLTVSPKGPGMVDPKVFNMDKFHFFMQQTKAHDVETAVKVVIFDQQDFEFASEIDAYLDLLNFPDNWRYLSLGNAYPPPLKEDMKLDEVKHDHLPGDHFGGLPEVLLNDYRILLEDYFKDPRLKNWKFLPQLHVLIWANKSGV